MRLTSRIQNIIIETISLLCILLFVYAAVSKILDFENFQVQLAQSPLITAYAGFIARAVLVVEIGIAMILAVPRFRLLGLFAAFGLMVLFTTYIFIILHYSSFVPCSCGGILEKMGWTTHLMFNIGFIILAVFAIFLMVADEKRGRFFVFTRLLSLGIFSVLMMVVVFLTSEDIVHHRNNFVRQFPHLAIKKVSNLDLEYNSYYFAGEGNGKIYLGNITAPSVITVIDTALKIKKSYHIKIKDTLTQFSSVQLKVFPPYFYVIDGSVPCIFKGKIEDWSAVLKMENNNRFSMAEVVDSNTIAFRTLSANSSHIDHPISI